MPPRREPNEKPETFTTAPVVFHVAKRKPGRPKNIELEPPLPVFVVTPEEQMLMEWAMAKWRADYELKDSDLLLLPLCAAELVKYYRLIAQELQSGSLVTMSRQHPGAMFARFMSQLLGTTRTNRQKNAKPDDDGADDFWKNFSVAS